MRLAFAFLSHKNFLPRLPLLPQNVCGWFSAFAVIGVLITLRRQCTGYLPLSMESFRTAAFSSGEFALSTLIRLWINGKADIQEH